MNIVIVSGLSGSGKSIALQAFEDIGYYCIDNLPANLLLEFTRELMRQEDSSAASIIGAAIGIDSRNRVFLDSLPENLHALTAAGIEYQVVFLQADDAVLIKRFSETRRKHPLTNETTSLKEGITLERELLGPMNQQAARRFDTSNTTPHELRSLVRDFASGHDAYGPTLLFESFGYKHGAPLDADFVFDVRCLPNPYWKPELRGFNGLDREIRDFLKPHPQVGKMIEHIRSFLAQWLPSFEAEHRSYITVAIGCTGGQHRSVYVADKLGEHFSGQRLRVQTRHRELSPDTDNIMEWSIPKIEISSNND